MTEFADLYIHGWHRKCWGAYVVNGVTRYRNYGRKLRNGKGLSAADLWVLGITSEPEAVKQLTAIMMKDHAEVEVC